MNKIYLILSVLSLVSCLNKKTPEVIVVVNTEEKAMIPSEIESDITFGVRGNCGMCKSTIESAAMSVEGVENASWSTESKLININVSSGVNDTIMYNIHGLHYLWCNPSN